MRERRCVSSGTSEDAKGGGASGVSCEYNVVGLGLTVREREDSAKSLSSLCRAFQEKKKAQITIATALRKRKDHRSRRAATRANR